MAKIVFLEDDRPQKTYEAGVQDTKEIFRLADMLSETELAKMQRAVNQQIEHKRSQLTGGKDKE